MSNTAPQLVGGVVTTSMSSGTVQTVNLPSGGTLAYGGRTADAILIFINWSFEAQVLNPAISSPDFMRLHSQSTLTGTDLNMTEEVWVGDYTTAASTTFTLPSAGSGAAVACIIDRNGWGETLGFAAGSTGSTDHHEPFGGLDPRFGNWPGITEPAYQTLFFCTICTQDWGVGSEPSAQPADYTMVGSTQGGGVGAEGAIPGCYLSSRRETTDVNLEDPGLWTWADYDIIFPATLPILAISRVWLFRYQENFIPPEVPVGYWGILASPLP